jgi:hypothetical protein
MTVQYLAPTKRKKIGKREAARLFLLHNGICCNCGLQININAGEEYFIEHVDALVLGGAEGEDTNRRPSHVRCKAQKDAADASARSKRDRIITTTYRPVDDGQRQVSRLQGRQFNPAPKQRSATRKIEKWSLL